MLGVGAVLGTVAFALMAWAVTSSWAPLAAIDQQVAGYFGNFSATHPAWVTFWVVVGVVGHPMVFQVMAGFAVVSILTLVSRRGRASDGQRRTIAFLLLGIGGGGLLSLAVKAIVARQRPPGAAVEVLGSSFPSGHALGITVATGTILLMTWPHLNGWQRTTATLAGALAVALVCFDRIALDVHSVSDVLAGFSLGVGWVCGVALACERRWPLGGSSAPARGQTGGGSAH